MARVLGNGGEGKGGGAVENNAQRVLTSAHPLWASGIGSEKSNFKPSDMIYVEAYSTEIRTNCTNFLIVSWR